MSTVWGIEGRAEYTPLADEEEGGGVGQAPLHRGSSRGASAAEMASLVASPAGQDEAAEIAELRARVAELEAELKHDEEMAQDVEDSAAPEPEPAQEASGGAPPSPGIGRKGGMLSLDSGAAAPVPEPESDTAPIPAALVGGKVSAGGRFRQISNVIAKAQAQQLDEEAPPRDDDSSAAALLAAETFQQAGKGELPPGQKNDSLRSILFSNNDGDVLAPTWFEQDFFRILFKPRFYRPVYVLLGLAPFLTSAGSFGELFLGCPTITSTIEALFALGMFFFSAVWSALPSSSSPGCSRSARSSLISSAAQSPCSTGCAEWFAAPTRMRTRYGNTKRSSIRSWNRQPTTRNPTPCSLAFSECGW